MLSILIEGWFDYPHSYSIVNVYQTIALLDEGVHVYFQEFPPYNENWQRLTSLGLLLTDEEVKRVKKVKHWQGEPVDVVYRIGYPYDLSFLRALNANGERPPMVLFYTSEFQRMKDIHFVNGNLEDFQRLCLDKKIIPITPSKWSAQALIKQFKYEPIIIPHGVDVSKYYPLETEQIHGLRSNYNIPNDAVVFLNIGAMTPNKNIKTILKCFYKISMLRENVCLVLKGLGSLYPSTENINTALKELFKDHHIEREQWKKTKEKLIVIDDTMDYKEMRELYNLCDCYLSPYLAEGFNMPCLEAAACGLSLIVTKGGSTDDFTHGSFSKRVRSYPVRTNEAQFDSLLFPDEGNIMESMLEVIDDESFRLRAKIEGPNFVRSKFTWKDIASRITSIANLLLPAVNKNTTNVPGCPVFRHT